MRGAQQRAGSADPRGPLLYDFGLLPESQFAAAAGGGGAGAWAGHLPPQRQAWSAHPHGRQAAGGVPAMIAVRHSSPPGAAAAAAAWGSPGSPAGVSSFCRGVRIGEGQGVRCISTCKTRRPCPCSTHNTASYDCTGPAICTWSGAIQEYTGISERSRDELCGE
jgi:hypothetical protein